MRARLQSIVIHDILVGDIWLASGQSNMEFPLSRAATAAEDIPHAGNDRIRLLMVNKKAADYALEDVDTDGWKPSTPDSAKDFSAVAWYFAREIEQREHVPVGVIDSTWGGTVAESWVRLTALGEDAALNPLFASRGKMLDHGADAAAEIRDEQRQQAEAKAQGKPIPQFPMASAAGELGSRQPVERHDCAAHADGDPRRDLVPGREQQRAGALAALQPHHAHAD